MKIYRGQELVGVIHRDAMYDWGSPKSKRKLYVKAKVSNPSPLKKGRRGSNQYEKKKKRSDWPVILFVYIFIIVLLAITIKVWDTYTYPPLISPIPKAGAQMIDGIIDPEVYISTPTPKAALASPTVTPQRIAKDSEREQIEAYIKTIFGKNAEMAINVTHHECSPQNAQYPGCVKKDNIEWSCGIWQINLRDPKTMKLIHAAKVEGSTLEEKCENLKNPYTATLIAHFIYSHQGFCPWSWYKANYCK